jgi:hypothetical protein
LRPFRFIPDDPISRERNCPGDAVALEQQVLREAASLRLGHARGGEQSDGGRGGQRRSFPNATVDQIYFWLDNATARHG